uniref:Uncharacterized protein n=1 Tax=uncultured marine virus TaxID=186617 RepID=A0A0F7LA25_9VIRU|nr:hypothetical protein [uncultured marine virus]
MVVSVAPVIESLLSVSSQKKPSLSSDRTPEAPANTTDPSVRGVVIVPPVSIESVHNLSHLRDVVPSVFAESVLGTRCPADTFAPDTVVGFVDVRSVPKWKFFDAST